MRKCLYRILMVLVLLCVIPLSRADADLISTENVVAKFYQTDARAMLDLVNDFRTGSEAWYWNSSDTEQVYVSDLAPLSWDYGLEKVAMQRAAELIVMYSHTRPSMESCFTAYGEVSGSLAYGAKGENIAYGYSTTEGMFLGWKEDNYGYAGQGHRRNMLGRGFTRIGIGCAADQSGRKHWAMELSSADSYIEVLAVEDGTKTVPVIVAFLNAVNTQRVSTGEQVSFRVTDSGTYQWQVSKDNGATWSNCTGTGSNTSNYSFTVQSTYDKYQYRCVITTGSGKVTSNAVALELWDPPCITKQPQSITVTEGDEVRFTVKATGNNLKYLWYRQTGGGWYTALLPYTETPTYTATASVEMNGYVVCCIVSNEYGETWSEDATLTVVQAAAPEITTQPKTVTVKLGDAVKFSVAASGTDLKYQWQYSKDGGKTWSNSTATGNKKATLSLTMKETYAGNKYRCVVSNNLGKVTSNAVTLKQAVAPTITTQPKSVVAKVGSIPKFTVAASGTNLKYQWQYCKSGSTTWNNSTASGNKTATLSVTMKESSAGNKYRCVVSNDLGKVTSNAVTLKLAVAPTITTQPKGVTAKAGATAKFTVAATGTSPKYQWQVSKDGGSTWSNSTATGNNTATLSVTMKETMAGRKYRCVVSNVAGKVTSNAVTLKLVVAPTITTQPKGVTAKAGATAKFTVAATGTSLKYQWQVSKDGGSTWSNSTASGCNTATLSITVKSTLAGRCYRCVVSNAAGKVTSSMAKLKLA